MVSGAFFRQLDRDTVESIDELNELFKKVRNVSESIDELNELFKKVRNVSESIGRYSVLRGLKELGVSVPSNNMATDD